MSRFCPTASLLKVCSARPCSPLLKVCSALCSNIWNILSTLLPPMLPRIPPGGIPSWPNIPPGGILWYILHHIPPGGIKIDILYNGGLPCSAALLVCPARVCPPLGSWCQCCRTRYEVIYQSVKAFTSDILKIYYLCNPSQ